MPESIDLSESTLFSLYARYPEIKFESSHELRVTDENFSSPCSNVTDHDDTRLSRESGSTAYTTPLRSQPSFVEPPEGPNLAEFLERVRDTNLPDVCKNGFSDLARVIEDLSFLLSHSCSRTLDHPPRLDKEEILRQSDPLMKLLRRANLNVKDEVNNISFLKGLAPFVVIPSEQDLWSNYRQMARLIVEYTALPCRTEQKLLEELAHLFDAYVYHPFLELLAVEDVDRATEDRINELYDAVMSLLANYKIWCRGMIDIKETYMVPTRLAIRNSPKVMQEIMETEASKAAARAAIGTPEAPGMQPADERLIQELNLSISRRQWTIPPRNRRRYRREHTV
ncbi:hypothetical protein LTR99_004145 [Exophiala xenobiotica]|uniref:Uncharacterized protein n=1 Tax=Vermiconidia calcicola TaxID=1690605 RepID=A0AAV9QM34_9PEZI|nr:hypothetical protein LTR92_010098 [Exophiala xenobiotica]KAK5545094.1 hypothetical protein LTR25_000101 [Vermiconidia calcicola]KAK5549262.1 hypothetical protein LTR23_001092 [Chaetothyriales sp. CCFEE 6169]KAK5268450.1 hypothetical protein LTR96_006157 [Exophiala xenobiotica]KAK5305079.1 hypothetical protein LTR99_004145 [Exophiala xenobiotica]